MTELEAEVLAAAYTYSAALLATSSNPSSIIQGEYHRALTELLNKAARLPPMATWVKAPKGEGPPR